MVDSVVADREHRAICQQPDLDFCVWVRSCHILHFPLLTDCSESQRVFPTFHPDSSHVQVSLQSILQDELGNLSFKCFRVPIPQWGAPCLRAQPSFLVVCLIRHPSQRDAQYLAFGVPARFE